MTSSASAKVVLLPWALLAGLSLLAAAIYWPGLGGPLLLDDHKNLEPLVSMQAGALTWQEIVAGREFDIGTRPVAMLTFVANWIIDSGDVWSLKLTNLLIHLVCGVLLFLLSGRLLAEPRTNLVAERWWLALLITAFWLLAPMLVSTVLYVIQRMAQLATLFVLAGLLCYVIGRQWLERRRRLGIASMLLAFLVFWPLATLSKQNGALLPLLALVVELGFFERPRSAGDRRVVHGLLVVTIALPALAALVVLGVDPASFRGTYQVRDFTILERLLTEARILFDYAFNLLLIPGGSPLGLFHDDFVVSRGLLDPPTTIVAIVGWIAVIVAAWRLRTGRWAAVLFGPSFFLAAHLLESTVIPLELYFEHRNYLPSTGLFISLGVAAGFLLKRTRLKKTFIAVIAVIPLANGVVTGARVVNWQSHEALLLAAAQTHPESPRVHTGLAGLYIGRGDLDKALEHLDRADALYGDLQSYAIALHRLVAYCASSRAVDDRLYAALETEDRIHDTVYTTNALRQLAENVEDGACTNIDLDRVASIVDRHVRETHGPGASDRNWALRIHTAKLLAALGRRREAVEHALAAAALQPTWLEPGLLAVEYQIELGDAEGARRTLEELRGRDDGRVKLYTRLIDAYQRRLD